MLTKSIAIYTPGTRNIDQPLTKDEINKIVLWTSKKFSRVFGGSTAYPVIGGWISINGYINEDIHIIKSWHNTSDDIAWNIAVKIARVLKRALHQESITIENQDGIDFI